MSALLAPSPVILGIFDAAREGSRAPAKVGICEWAEREIRILKGPEQGRLRLARAPYMREMLEAFTDPLVKDITFKTASQVAKTTLMHICAAYAMDEDPGDAIYVMPTEELAREMSSERIRPMFEKSPGIRTQFTGEFHDQQNVRLRFLRSTLYFGWAKSPASLAGRPTRYAFLDETNKYPTFSGKEGDPVELAKERTKLFWNRKVIVASTPTTATGIISRRFNESDKRRYHVPCPHCGEMQLLITPNLKWPQGVTADEVRADNLAWYECRKCGGKIIDRDKPRMLSSGKWIAEQPGVRTHRGYQINTLYSPWVPFSEYAAKFIESADIPALLMNFQNSWEANDWLEKAAEVTEETVAALKIPYEFGVVPLGGLILTAGIDVQKDCVRYVVRAWGADSESWLIDCGMFLREKDASGRFTTDEKLDMDSDLAKLAKELMPTQYECANGSRMAITLAFIDNGYRSEEVNVFASKLRPRVHACKGDNEIQIDGKSGKMIPRRLMPIEKLRNEYYTRINTTYYKDIIQKWRESARRPWHIPESVDETYLHEISAEHKVIEFEGSNNDTKHVWKLRPGYKHNHYWDCEVYALAAADQKGFRKLTAEPRAPQRPRAGVKNWDGRAYSILNR